MATLAALVRRVPKTGIYRCFSTSNQACQQANVDVKEFNKKTMEMMLKRDWLNKLDGHSPYHLSFVEPHLGKEFVKGLPLPDQLGATVGNERYELLNYMIGNDDPFEVYYRHIRESSNESPNLVPSKDFYRMIACECEPDALIKFMYLYKGATQRCKCGHFFKLVEYEEKERYEETNVSKFLDHIDKFPEAKSIYDKLKDMYQKLIALTQKIDAEGYRLLGTPASEQLPTHSKLRSDVVEKVSVDSKLIKEYENLTETMQKTASDLFKHYEKAPLS